MGRLGFGVLSTPLPHQLYQTPFLSGLGMPAPGFISGDYYTIIPFMLMYLCGVSLGHTLQDYGCPSWLKQLSCKPLSWVGRHALPIYVLHQPLIMLTLELMPLR